MLSTTYIWELVHICTCHLSQLENRAACFWIKRSRISRWTTTLPRLDTWDTLLYYSIVEGLVTYTNFQVHRVFLNPCQWLRHILLWCSFHHAPLTWRKQGQQVIIIPPKVISFPCTSLSDSQFSLMCVSLISCPMPVTSLALTVTTRNGRLSLERLLPALYSNIIRYGLQEAKSFHPKLSWLRLLSLHITIRFTILLRILCVCLCSPVLWPWQPAPNHDSKKWPWIRLSLERAPAGSLVRHNTLWASRSTPSHASIHTYMFSFRWDTV